MQYSVMLSLVVYFQPNRIHRHTIRNCHIAGLLRHLMIAYNYTLADHLPQRRSLQAMSQCIYAASANFVVLCLYRAPYPKCNALHSDAQQLFLGKSKGF